jgi:hypothetical protein
MTRSENNAAADAVGSQLAEAAAQVNPIVGLALALGRPLLRLFRRRQGPPVAIRKMKLESYSASPVPPGSTSPHEGSSKDPRTILEGSPTRRTTRRRPPGRRPGSALAARKGGLNHG